jgi:hypothetical protein
LAASVIVILGLFVVLAVPTIIWSVVRSRRSGGGKQTKTPPPGGPTHRWWQP